MDQNKSKFPKIIFAKRYLIKFMVFSLIMILLVFTIITYISHISENSDLNTNVKYPLQSNEVSNSMECTYNNIKLSIEGITSDNIRTILYLKVSGNNLKNDNNFLPIENVKLFDKNGKYYSVNNIKEAQTNNQPNGAYFKKIQFDGGPEENDRLTLVVSKIGEKTGAWTIDNINTNVINTEEIEINKELAYDNITFSIKKIKYSTNTVEIVLSQKDPNHRFINIKGGKISNSTLIGDFINGTSEIDNKDDTQLNCVLLFEPINLMNVDKLECSLIYELNTRDSIKFTIPLKN